MQQKIVNVDDDAFRTAVETEIRDRLVDFATGVNAFRVHQRRQPKPTGSVIWQEGTTKVCRIQGDGPTVVLVPSLINRASILDLTEDRSLVRHLADSGFDVFLVDWDAPGIEEMQFHLRDYVSRLMRALSTCADLAGQPVNVVGYCMGGLLALAAILCDPSIARSAAFLATPWDFSAMPAVARDTLAAALPSVETMTRTLGVLPVDVIQAMFASQDPIGATRKFRQFAGMKKNSAAARRFVALEDWLNDGVPLAGAVARECLTDWYRDNLTARGEWRCGGNTVDPGALEIPCLVLVPQGDTIVPPASALALADSLPNATLLHADAGHIGMVAGSKAKRVLYDPLSKWLFEVQRCREIP